MSDVSLMLQDIKSVGSTKEKARLLKKYCSEDATFRRTLRMGMDPLALYEYKITPAEFDSIDWKEVEEPYDLEDALAYVEASKPFRNDAARTYLKNFLAMTNPTDAMVVADVINKDLVLGIGPDAVSKQLAPYGDDFPVFKPMKAQQEKAVPLDTLEYPLICQTKIDAARAFLVYDSREEESYFLSATGKRTDAFTHITAKVVHEATEDTPSFIIDGELVAKDKFGNLLPRAKSNGLFNKAIKGTIRPEEVSMFNLIAWDYLENAVEEDLYETAGPSGRVDQLPYYATTEEGYMSEDCRFYQLLDYLKGFSDESNIAIEVVNTEVVNNPAEASLAAQNAFEAGEEGAILKTFGMQYEPKRTRSMVKLKKSAFADVRVTGVNEGKNPGTLGSLSYETDDGMISGDASGIPDAIKASWWKNPEKIIGQVIEVRYMEVSERKGAKDGHKTLYGPAVFIRVRDDKDETSKLEELK